ncbi:MAG: protein-methionine-sulfoxide reductase catalytic subunit MsrP [Gammaproteobacteria bacterium]|nr:protein-methionine-sulfoxide reductase catalytic subunit MsrP [Gammaproteobacteria bacterium]
MLIRKPKDIPTSEITPESIFLSRRRFTSGMAAIGIGAAAGSWVGEVHPGPTNDLKLTPEDIITSYNNFYEFGTDKDDPKDYAHHLTTTPWQVEVSGAVGKPGSYDVQELIKGFTAEERIYRLRCVEAWSMVVPWLGIPLRSILDRFEPLGNAKYVEFKTLHRPSEMRAQGSFFSSIDWPYVEGLRLDEANHPLTIMAVGLYGKPLPNQNGAPWRLVVPWKYGFKSIKSIVSIRLTERKPKNTWNLLQPREYGFYANVNPSVDHPRWSQASERRLPSTLFNPNRIPTLPFNGYAEQVAGLYAGMDLRRHF